MIFFFRLSNSLASDSRAVITIYLFPAWPYRANDDEELKYGREDY